MAAPVLQFSDLLKPSPTSSVCILQKGDWAAEKVISIPSKKVEGWLLPEMPSEYQGSLGGVQNTSKGPSTNSC